MFKNGLIRCHIRKKNLDNKNVWTEQIIHLIIIRNQKQEPSNKEIDQGLPTVCDSSLILIKFGYFFWVHYDNFFCKRK